MFSLYASYNIVIDSRNIELTNCAFMIISLQCHSNQLTALMACPWVRATPKGRKMWRRVR